MQPDSLPDVARFSTRLAENNVRVMRSVERLPNRVDDLVSALRQADWSEIRRLSERMVSGDNHSHDTIRYRAERVCEELGKPNNVHAIRQSVVRLIGACGTPTFRDKNAAAKQTDWKN
jgi:hypothetical protein